MTSPPLLRFTTVTGYFLQDDPSTDPDTFDYVRFEGVGISGGVILEEISGHCSEA
jgi:hypothetical protein